jgi:hypothetical protein
MGQPIREKVHEGQPAGVPLEGVEPMRKTVDENHAAGLEQRPQLRKKPRALSWEQVLVHGPEMDVPEPSDTRGQVIRVRRAEKPHVRQAVVHRAHFRHSDQLGLQFDANDLRVREHPSQYHRRRAASRAEIEQAGFGKRALRHVSEQTVVKIALKIRRVFVSGYLVAQIRERLCAQDVMDQVRGIFGKALLARNEGFTNWFDRNPPATPGKLLDHDAPFRALEENGLTR